MQGRAHIEQKSAAGSIQRVPGFKGLSYKPLDKQVALANPELKNEGDAREKMRRPGGVEKLELELKTQTKLHDARLVRSRHVQETGVAEACY